MIQWILALLILLLLLQAFDVRKRLRQLKVIPPEPSAAGGQFHILAHPAVQLSAEDKNAVASFMNREGLDICDLVPRELNMALAVDVATFFRPKADHASRFSPGFTAGHAIAVAEALLIRADVPRKETYSYPELVRIAADLKSYAWDQTGSAVLPGLAAVPRSFAARRQGLWQLPWKLVGVILGVRFFMLLVIAVGLVIAPFWGLAAYLVDLSVPWLMLSGGPLAVRHYWLAPFGRFYADLVFVFRIFFARFYSILETPERAEHRAAYRALLDNSASFFEVRRDDCPHCGAAQLRRFMCSGDQVQGKPGLFILDECGSCHLIFQNPRLSLAGLNFYYQDFYDGIGKDTVAVTFALANKEYLARAGLVAAHTQPRDWLDVGTGHGHFCVVARDLLRGTRFDGLDMSEGVSWAQKRGWISRAYRGIFPELADSLEDSYDVVSMHHYLEHVISPRAEIVAARKVLRSRGYLLIELPNPKCKLSRFLKRFSTIWLQPQHLQFYHLQLMVNLLQEEGFEVLVSEVGAAHQSVELFGFVYILAGMAAPSPFFPWNKFSLPLLARYYLVTMISLPFYLLARLLDKIDSLLLRSDEWSTAFRILARKRT